MLTRAKLCKCVSTPSQKQTRRERPKSASYLRLKNIQGTTIGNIWKFFFRKKYLVKNVAQCRKTRALNVLYKPKTS